MTDPVDIYRSPAGRRAVESLYERGVGALPVPVEERWVETGLARTHLLVAGPEDAPPLVVFHGGNTTNPLTLAWVADLADEYRLYAPDIPGQPGLSGSTAVDPTGDDYGEWVADLLDALGVERAPMIGVSYGAGVVLRVAATVPDRVAAAALVVPTGFGIGSLPRLAVGIGVPSLLYRFLPRERLLEHVVGRLATDPDELDPLFVETLAAVFRHVKLDSEFPSVDPAELEGFDAPVYVAVGTEDPFFPPEVVLPKADAWFADVRMERLVGERHLLSAGAREHVRGRIRDLVAAHRGRPEQSR